MTGGVTGRSFIHSFVHSFTTHLSRLFRSILAEIRSVGGLYVRAEDDGGGAAVVERVLHGAQHEGLGPCRGRDGTRCISGGMY